MDHWGDVAIPYTSRHIYMYMPSSNHRCVMGPIEETGVRCGPVVE